MSLVGWAALATSLAYAQLLLVAILRRGQGLAVLIFALYCAAGLLQSLVEVGFQSAGTVRAAQTWADLRSCWPLTPVLLLHFAYCYAGLPRRRAQVVTVGFLYACAVGLTLIGLSTDLLGAGIERDAWGWYQHRAATPLARTAGAWAAGVGVATLVVLFRHLARVKDAARRAQAWHVAVGAAIPIVVNMFAEGLLPSVGLRPPPVTMVAVLLGSLLIARAIDRHGLLLLSAATAAERIVAAMTDALFLVDRVGTIQRANPAALHLLEHDEDDLIGRRFVDLVLASGPVPGARAVDPAATMSPASGAFMSAVRTKGGRRVPVRISTSVVKTPTGAVIGTVVAIQNLTEMQQAQEMISMLDRAIATTRTGITIKDRDGHIVYCNDADVRMHGYASADELLGKHARVFGPPEATRPMPSGLLESLDGLAREGLNVRKDGSRFPVRMVSDLVKNQVGKVIGVVTVCEDITERRLVEEELRRSHDEARATSAALIQAEKLTALGEVAASTVHELNQPLNAIKIICQAALRAIGRGEAGPCEEDVREIAEMVNRAAEVVDHVRRFSRRTEGVPHGTVDMNAVVTSAVALLGVQLRDRGIELVQQLAPGLPAVIGDAIALEQVLLNLILNAKDALARDRHEARRIEVTTRAGHHDHDGPRSSVVVEVADNGPGIPEHLHQAIFESFFTTKEAGNGTGLGLAIVRRIIDQHHGAVELKSTPGHGARFTITLPGVAALASG